MRINMFKYNYLLALATMTFLVAINNTSFAGFIEWSNTIQTTSGGTPVEIGEPEAIDSVAATVPITTYNDVNVLNRISLGIDWHYNDYFSSSMDVTVTVKVKRWDASFNPMADTTFDLTIAYNPFDSVQTISLNKAEFNNAYKMVFSIEAILVNGNSETILPGNLFIQGDIFIERYIQLGSTPVSSTKLLVDVDCDEVDDALEVSWDAITGAEEYQLEWAYINDYGASGTLTSDQLPFDFKFNSTRITTANLSYTISLIFDKGWLVYRVRPVGVSLSNPSQFLFGDWNEPESGMVDDISSSNSENITGIIQHEGNVNWQYSATYAEQGKKKEIVSYYDGSLRNRQTVTKINSDENVIVGETIYDHQGRPAINVLPTPVGDPTCNPGTSESTIHLYRNFNKDDSSVVYSRNDFDLSDTNAICGLAAGPMSDSSGSSNYYSTLNPDQTLEQGYVPNANGYPFTQVEYTPDNTGRIRRQSGVGEEFQLGTGHETKYLYGSPDQMELDRLFGSEVGNELHYKKNVVIDAHGQASISYLDQEGRVIATALAGDAPSNLIGIPSEADEAVELTVNAFGDNNEMNQVSIDNNALIFSKSILVAYQSTYTFNYDFEVEPVDIACLGDVCVDCVYDLSIEVVDECGVNLAPTALENKLVGKFTSDGLGYHFHGVCTEPENGTFDTTFTVSLPPGSYMVTKKLTVNEQALNDFVELYLNSECAMTLEDFEDLSMSTIDTSGCEITCDNCFEHLGTLEDFIANGEGNANDYYLRIKDCESLCSGSMSYCEVMKTLLQMDMSPGGQYGEYINTSSGANDFSFPLSIYNISNVLPDGGYWKSPELNTPNGVVNMYLDENGDRSMIFLTPNPSVPGGWLPQPYDVNDIQIDPLTGMEFIYPEQLNYTVDFIDAFIPSWGNSLIVYHPEYCYYETCLTFEKEVNANDAFTSASFDDEMAKYVTFQEAQTAGFINGSGLPTNWFAPVGLDNTNASIPWDPYVYYSSSFSLGLCDDLGGELQQLFNQYKFIDGQWRSMAEVAAYTVRCGGNFNPSPSPDCFDFGQLYNGVLNVEILDEEWYLLRSLYMGEKQKLRREYAECLAIKECSSYNSCIGNDEFMPYPEMVTHFGGFSIWSSPYFNSSQPCSIFTHFLYFNKVKRFSSEEDLPEQDANGVAYEVYLQTGQCPVPFTLQMLFAALAADGNIDGTGVDLNAYVELSAVFQAENNFNNPGLIPTLEYDAIVTGSTLNATWTDTDASTVFLSMSMTLGGGAAWTDVSNIYNFYATSSGTFTADGLVNDTTVVPITGTITHFSLDPCYFEYECSSNQLALNLTSLINTLHFNGDVSSTSNIAINPYVNTYGTFSGLTNIYIENAANVGSNLYWVSVSSTLYKIFDPSGTPANGLYLNFTSALSPSFLSTVQYFGSITSTGEYSFEVEAFLIAGGSVILEGTLYRETLGVMLGIPTGDCGLPIPAACQTVAHNNFNDLNDLLVDAIITQDYDGTSQIDLFQSIAFTPNIQSSLPAGIDATTSDLSTAGDTLEIFAGECTIQLAVETGSGAVLSNLISISGFSTIGTVNNYNNFLDFQFTGTFDNGSGPFTAFVFGTSCLPLKECNPCGDDAYIPVPEDTIALRAYLDEQVKSGKMIFDNSTAMTSGTYEEIFGYMKDSYIGDRIEGNMPLAYVPIEEDSCITEYDQYRNCILDYNATEPEYPISSYETYSVFMENGWCNCIDIFCEKLDSVINRRVSFRTEEEFLDYIDFSTFCDPCTIVYDQYLDCITIYNSTKPKNPIRDLVSYEDFITYGWCDCVDEFCNRLDSIVQNEMNFDTYEDFLVYIDFDSFCEGCQTSYLEYVDCYNTLVSINHKDYTLPPFFTYSQFVNGGYCYCVGIFCNRVDEYQNSQVGFEGQEDFYNYYDFEEFCDSCTQSYIDYLICVTNYNSQSPAWEVKDIIKYEDFIANGWCHCVDEFCAILNGIITQNMNFATEEDFLNYIDFNLFCEPSSVLDPVNPCEDAYWDYIDCIAHYNASSPTYPVTYIATLENYLNTESNCYCVDQFCASLNSILAGLVTFSSQAEFDLYIEKQRTCRNTPPCAPDPSTGIPVVMPEVELENDCIQMMINQAMLEAQNNYNNYVDSLSTALIQQYMDHCLQPLESMNYTYENKLYHFTLYYYDQAGNLIKTIPPAGVEMVNITSYTDPIAQQISNDRTLHVKNVYTSHRLATRYEYNSLNQLVAQSTPDTDPMDQFDLNLPNGLNNKLITRKIQMVDASRGYLGGEINGRGYLYQTTDGGNTWTRVYNLVAADLKKVLMFDANNGIALGEKGIVLRTTNGGDAWDMVDTWTTAGTGMIHDLNDAAFIDQGGGNYDVFLVGENKCITFSSNILASTPTFTVLNTGVLGTNVSISSIVSDGSTYFITANDLTANKASIYKYDSGLSSWIPENNFVENSFTDVQYYDLSLAYSAYACGVDGRLYKNTQTNVTGSTWLHVRSNLVDPIQTIRFFDENQGVALVEQGGVNYLYRTVNGGESWEQISENTFNHLSISADKNLVLAVGQNGAIEVVVPFNGTGIENIIVASPGATMNFTAGWIDREVNGLGNTNAHIIVSNDAGTMYYSSNGFTTYPVWNSTSISSNVVKEIVAMRGWTANQTIYGAVTTVAGDLLRLKKESTVTTVSLAAMTGTGTNDYFGLTTNGQYIYTTQDQTSLARIPMSAVLTGFTVFPSPLTASVKVLDFGGTRIISVGSNGNILDINLNIAGTSIVAEAIATKNTAPNKLFCIGFDASNSRYLATGEDGVMYQRNSGLITWNRINTATNESIFDYDEESSVIYTVGSNGLSKSGTIVSNDFVSQDFLMTNGSSTSTSLSGVNLNAVVINSNKLYAVGNNGKVVFNSNIVSNSYNVLTQGSKNLYDVTTSIGTNPYLSVGEYATIVAHGGPSFLLKKEVFTPAVIDLNFSNPLSGSVLCNKFVIRKTTTGGGDFNVIKPGTAQAPTYTYTKIWNTNATTAYVFGNTTQHKVINETASPYTIAGYTVNNVRALDQGPDANILHLVNGENVVTLNLTSNTATSILALGSGALANAIHVFNNNDYLVVGESGLYKHYTAANVSLPTPTVSFTGVNFNAIAFKDNINGVIVGDNGAYFFTTDQSVSTNGFITATEWESRSVISQDPLPSIANVNIYSISFGSSTTGVLGGEYVPAGSFSHPYVRRIYDAGMRYSSRFFYDKLGRLVVSQNARQYNLSDKKYSYTLYDALGRVVEVGKKTENTAALKFNTVFGTTVSNFFNPKVIDDANLLSWINGNGERREVTKSYYDATVITGLPSVMDLDLSTQRKRIVHVTYEALFDGDDQTYDHASHYKYDIHGNVKTLLQDNRRMAEDFTSLATQRIKRMDYAYDLVSGNVHRMSVQDGEVDQWHHAYKYDADNRIVDAFTNTESPLVPISGLPQDLENELTPNSAWQKDASYYYYDHGPLARAEIGQNQLQGIDYVYNLQGWLKGVNSSVLDQENDPGKDSKDGTINQFFAKDVMGFGLNYYSGDYLAINGSGTDQVAKIQPGSHAASNSHDLFNGNIRYMQTAITNPVTFASMPMLNAYQYDQLNRLKFSRSYESDLSANVWDPLSYAWKYYNEFEYDAMGNIEKQIRNNRSGAPIDDLEYGYQKTGGKLLRNRLYHLDDAVLNTAHGDDLDDMGLFEEDPTLINTNNNYSYDEEGRLIKDEQEEIDLIVWRVDGKVKEIHRPLTSEKKNVSFDYDAMGNRIAKHLYNAQTLVLEKSTYYILDAQGNTMNTYDHEVQNSNTVYKLEERQIYGSSRLGMNTAHVDMFTPEPLPSTGVLGLRYYELSNHLGNVLTVINDEITPLSSDNVTVDGYQVGIIRVTDYSPFGVELNERTLENQYLDENDTTYTDEVDTTYSSNFSADESIIPTFDGWFGNLTTTALNVVTGMRLRAVSSNAAHGMNHYFTVVPSSTYRINFDLDKGAMSSVGFSVYNVDGLGNEVLLFNSTMSTTTGYSFSVTPTESQILVKLHGSGTFYMDNFIFEEETETPFYDTNFESVTSVAGLFDGWGFYPNTTNVWISSGELAVKSATNGHGVFRRYNASVGVSHTVTFDVDLSLMSPSGSSIALVIHRVNSLGVRSGTYVIQTLSSTGSKTATFTTSAGFTAFDVEIRRSSATGTFTVDDIVVGQTVGANYSTSNFTSPVIQIPSYDGWQINTQTTKFSLPTYSSSKRVLADGPVFQEFSIDDEASYKIDFNFIKGTVANGKLEVFKVVGGTSTSILSQTISTNGNYSYTVTPGENLMRVVFSGTGVGNFYVDNIVIDEFTYTELYSTDFETATIVQPDVDGWLCDLSTAYLTADAPIGQEERLIVMGTSTSGAYQYFAATPGNDFTLSYNLAFLGAVGTMQVEIYEQNPGGPLTYLTNGSVSSNGAHTLSFTPTMSEIYVHFASNNTFALNEIELSYEYEQMFVNYAGQSGDYRYGFNGMEMDNEVKGQGNSYTTEFRQYDPRVGRWLSLDPLMADYPWHSAYVAFDNNPIYYADPTGLYSEERANKKADRINNSSKARKYGFSAQVVYGGKENGYGVLSSGGVSSIGGGTHILQFGAKNNKGDEQYNLGQYESLELSYDVDQDDKSNGLYATGMRINKENGNIEIHTFAHGLAYEIIDPEVIGIADLPINGTGPLGKVGNIGKISKNMSRMKNALGAIGSIRSSKGLIKAAQLPTKGKIRFVPRASDIKNGQLLQKNHGYVDKFGNIWTKPKGNIVGEAHWDVQLSGKGKNMLGHLSNSGEHINVTKSGKIAH